MGFVINSFRFAVVSTPWDISNASYDNVSLDVAARDGNPTGVAFSADGTKMYMVGAFSDSVHQYSLSTAWDLSTASYDSVSFDVSGQDDQPHGLAFSSDGTKMYVTGVQTDAVYQYSLTAWDLSTASYDSVSLGVSGQDRLPSGLAFSSDGTKMYIMGGGNKTAYQYSLTAWDLSTASYDSVSFSVEAQDFNHTEVAFSSDGTKMYMVGGSNDSVHQYSLSTAWDLSTASYDSVLHDVSGQDVNPQGAAFSADGTKMYVVGAGTDTIYQYSV